MKPLAEGNIAYANDTWHRLFSPSRIPTRSKVFFQLLSTQRGRTPVIRKSALRA